MLLPIYFLVHSFKNPFYFSSVKVKVSSDIQFTICRVWSDEILRSEKG
jgi:hypothetical protein